MGAEPRDVPAPAVSSSSRRLPEWLTSERTLELAATLLPAFASLGTAWSAYQSRQWSGEQAAQTARATAARISVNRASAVASRQLQIDVATFIQWINAREEHHPALAAFYAARFRPEFKPAFDAWFATRPFTNKAAPLAPFAMHQYRCRHRGRPLGSRRREPPRRTSPRGPTSTATTTCSRSSSSLPRSSSPGSASSSRYEP